jgi:hypothetical protein
MKWILTAFVTIIAICSCNRSQDIPAIRSAYYWSTAFSIDSTKRQFLKSHDIRKIYLRYFDVVVDASGQLTPNATVRFDSKMPNGTETVPTVYIVNECMYHDVSGLAEKILKRILQMNATNDIHGVKEIQIDCDWTLRTQKKYFNFLQSLRSLAGDKGLAVSATIRLHQLSQPSPPVDRGVLMMYNTGDFTDIHCQHPILDIHDVAPYLRYIDKYDLPMSTAYPVFQWKLLYRGGKYVGIIHHDEELPILPGDSIICRRPSLKDIMEAKNTLSDIKSDLNHEIIIFDINDYNITRFKTQDYEKIFNH